MDTLLFQVLQISTAVVFLFFISFYRKKSGFKPLINENWTSLLKVCVFIILAISGYGLATLGSPIFFNWLGFATTVLGTFFVAKAKIDLSKSHTWAGFCMERPTLVANGIYSYMRHPLYVGIYLFVIGVLISLIASVMWQLTVVAFVALLYVLVFLAVVARRETRILERKLGAEFTDYKNKVHFCLPVRKYLKKVIKLATYEVKRKDSDYFIED